MRRSDFGRGTLPGLFDVFTREDFESIGANLPILVTSTTAFLLVIWGGLVAAARPFPRAAYGLALVGAGAGLYLVARAFANGARWALPVVAAVPVVEALAVYWYLRPPFPMGGPGDLLAWLLVVALALVDLAFLVGPVHPSWAGEHAEGP